MSSERLPDLYAEGRRLDTSPEAFGELHGSDDLRGDREALRQRLAEEGYLYLPGLLERDEVLAVRAEIFKRLDERGMLCPEHPVSEGVVREEAPPLLDYLDALTENNPLLDKLLYAGQMMRFYEFFLGGPVRHFDYTWIRAKVTGGLGTTAAHYDRVYMGRGTESLYTSWTPLTDVPLVRGGLMILEHSHKLEQIKATYGQMDVDAYCTNNEEADYVHAPPEGPRDPRWPPRIDDGAYSHDAPALQKQLNRRWLTAAYRAGDLLIFGPFTMHAGMDNQTRYFRLSTDSRYQRADQAVDERWVGETIVGHGPAGKKGMIC